jgi:hypothetical protein
VALPSRTLTPLALSPPVAPTLASSERGFIIAAYRARVQWDDGSLLFLFGLPPAINREGHEHLLLEQVDESTTHRAVRYDRFGRLGMAPIVAVFLCQFVGGLLK